MNNREYFIGIDIGGTNVRIVAMDRIFRVASQKAIRTTELTKGADTVSALIFFIKTFIAALDGDIIAVSIGMPSTLNRERTVVISTPNVSGFDNIPIVDLLELHLELPVFIEKDSSMLLYFDLHIHQIPQSGIILGFYMGTGIGNVIMINGKLLLGKNGVAAELGHIPSLGKDLPCTCGNIGCMEEYVAGKALERLCSQYFEGTDIRDIFKVFSADERIIRFVEDMAVPISSEINILDPDHVVIGGGVIAMENFPVKLLEKSIRKYCRKPHPESNLTITYSESPMYGGAVGAAIFGSYKLSQCQMDVKKEDLYACLS
jgi:allose kinase